MSASSPPRTRNPKGQGGRLRQDIIESACALLEESGSENDVTLRSTARRAGVTASALYQHFDGREQIVQAAVTQIFDEYERSFTRAVQASADPVVRLRKIGAAYVRFGHDRPAAYRALFSRHDPSRLPEVGARAAALHQVVIDTIVECGWPAADADRAALMLWMLLHGLAELPPAHPRFPWPRTEELLDRLIEPYADPSGHGWTGPRELP